MACYCNREVRVMGRLLEVTFRYGSFMDAKVVKGKPLPGVGRSWDYDDRSEKAHRVTIRILQILRRHGQVSVRGDLTSCRTCSC